MKKTVLFVSFLALPGSAFADDLGSAFSGPYASVGVGYQANRIYRENVHTTDGLSSFNQPSTSGNGPTMQAQVGYGFKLGERFSISADAFFNLGGGNTSDIKAAFFQDRVVQKIGNSFGFTLAPGFYLTSRTLLFAKAGIGFASWEYYRATYNVSTDTSLSGAVVGVGVKHLLSDRLFVGADLTRQTYQAASALTSLSNFQVQVSTKSRQTTGTFSVGYLF